MTCDLILQIVGADIRMGTEFERDLVAIIPAMRAFSHSLTRDPDKAGDLVQDAIVCALRAKDQYRSSKNSSMKSWVFAILKNLYITNLRRKVRAFVHLDNINEEYVAQPAHQHSVLEFRELGNIIMKLKPEVREALILIGAIGFTCEETAKMRNYPLGTVKSRLLRGRAELYDLLGAPC